MSGFFSKLLKIVGIAMFVLVPGAGQIWLTLATSFLVGGGILGAQAQQKKAKRAMQASLSEAQAQIVPIKQSIVSRRIVYGRARIGGIFTYIDNSDDNQYVYLIMALCDGPIKAITDIYFNDEVVPLTESAGVWNGTGKYTDKVRIVKHLGATDQTADSLMVSDSTEWTTNHRLRGVAYLALRIDPDPTAFPNGLPQISAVVHGRNDITDPDDDLNYYSTNVAMCLAHYMSLTDLGPNIDWTNEIEETLFIAAKDICDETVDLEATDTFTTDSGTDANEITSASAHGLYDSQIVNFTSTVTLPAGLSAGTDYYVINSTKTTFEVSTSIDGDPVTITNDGTGTHTFTAKELRYTFNGVINLDLNPEDIMRQFRDAMAGAVVYIGGKWSMYAGAYQTPTFTIDEDILAGPISFRPKRSKRDRYNTVKGFFMVHRNRWNPADYPPVTNSTYVTNDGEELIQGLDLPATCTPQMAQRIAKIVLERGRMERSLELRCNIEALRAEAGKTVLVNLPRYNIDNEPYMVEGFALEPNKKGMIEIALSLTQEASDNYTWTSGTDEQSWSVADEPVLSDGSVDAPTNFSADPITSGRSLGGIELTWDQSTDRFVLVGGTVLVQWRVNGAGDYTESATLTGDSVSHRIDELTPGTQYDFRIAFRSSHDVQSDWAEDTAVTVVASESSAFNYKHTQATPNTTWTINHNLGYEPSIRVVDSGNNPVFGYSQDSDENTTVLTFNSAISGAAYCS